MTQENEGAAPQSGPAKASISQDDWEVMNERVAELQQTKVESASKFRVKLSGLVLATALTSTGHSEQTDVPEIVLPESPDFPVAIQLGRCGSRSSG